MGIRGHGQNCRCQSYDTGLESLWQLPATIHTHGALHPELGIPMDLWETAVPIVLTLLLPKAEGLVTEPSPGLHRSPITPSPMIPPPPCSGQEPPSHQVPKLHPVAQPGTQLALVSQVFQMEMGFSIASSFTDTPGRAHSTPLTRHHRHWQEDPCLSAHTIYERHQAQGTAPQSPCTLAMSLHLRAAPCPG